MMHICSSAFLVDYLTVEERKDARPRGKRGIHMKMQSGGAKCPSDFVKSTNDSAIVILLIVAWKQGALLFQIFHDRIVNVGRIGKGEEVVLKIALCEYVNQVPAVDVWV